MIHHKLYPTYIAKMQLRGKINIALRVNWVVICRGSPDQDLLGRSEAGASGLCSGIFLPRLGRERALTKWLVREEYLTHSSFLNN